MIHCRNDIVPSYLLCRQSTTMIGIIILFTYIFYSISSSSAIYVKSNRSHMVIVVPTSRVLVNEEQSNGRGVGNDNEKQQHDETHNDNNNDNDHHTTSYTQQRHPNNYYYTNGNRVSSNSATKSAYSYYDYNDDDSYYNSRNKNNRNRSRPIYKYTTKLSDVYWCLLIALGWTIWMIHSIATLRQQQYNTMMSTNYNIYNSGADGIHIDSGTAINDVVMIKPSPAHDNDGNRIRIFQTNYSSLLLLRGHVLDVIHHPVVLASETPMVGLFPSCTVIVDYVVERQQQPSTSTAALSKSNADTTLPTIQADSDNPSPTTEYIQIRKHFETTLTNIEVGFGNVEVLVLPNDPMCSMLKYDYDVYIQQEQRIQRVIELEQYNRLQRRKRKNQRRLQDQNQQRRQGASSKVPMIHDNNEDVSYPLSNLNSDVIKFPRKMQVDILDDAAEDVILFNDNEEDDDLFGCDMCYTCCDCTYDQYQWKRLSLFFAALLVLASILGTVHVVSRMDPRKKYLGWISLCIGLTLLFPTAMYIHKVMILCHRWSEAQPVEKQGFIVQSSTMTGTITSYNNGDENDDIRNSKNRNSTTPLTAPVADASSNMMSLADACMRPSCRDILSDLCDPTCSNHTINAATSLHPSQANGTNMEFSYVVPEMSGCYFINYPTKDPQHSRHKNNMRKSKVKGFHSCDPRLSSSSVQNDVTQTNQSTATNLHAPVNIPASSNHQHGTHDASSIVSTSSISSISSNDDPTMKQLNIWSTIVNNVQKMGNSNDNDDSV